MQLRPRDSPDTARLAFPLLCLLVGLSAVRTNAEEIYLTAVSTSEEKPLSTFHPDSNADIAVFIRTQNKEGEAQTGDAMFTTSINSVANYDIKAEACNPGEDKHTEYIGISHPTIAMSNKSIGVRSTFRGENVSARHQEGDAGASKATVVEGRRETKIESSGVRVERPLRENERAVPNARETWTFNLTDPQEELRCYQCRSDTNVHCKTITNDDPESLKLLKPCRFDYPPPKTPVCRTIRKPVDTAKGPTELVVRECGRSFTLFWFGSGSWCECETSACNAALPSLHTPCRRSLVIISAVSLCIISRMSHR